MEKLKEYRDNIDLVLTYTYQFMVGRIDYITYERRLKALWHLLVRK